MSYQPKLIAFVDILGFGNLVYASEDDERKYELIRETLSQISNVEDFFASEDSFYAHSNFHELGDERKELLRKVFEQSRADNDVHRPTITTFSDSIVLSAPPTLQGLTLFRYVLTRLVVCVSRFRLLLRGGITFGLLYHDTKLIFGPAMNRAYELESKVAIVPRILIDDRAAAFVANLAGEGKGIELESLVDADGKRYLDVLTLGISGLAQNNFSTDPRAFLADIKVALATGLANSQSGDKVRLKYEWFSNYLRDFIGKNQEISVVVKDTEGAPIRTDYWSTTEFAQSLPGAAPSI